ncbi:MAG TPA: HD domain-containing phosphohydrolase [Verrucomicrobiae bacterium]|nr:HD domain-containing phosphohydrolase [Verrucomicrobiae bacterium]
MSVTDNRQTEPLLHRILIVDDEEIVLVALRETLRREGYEVVTAPNAIQALELLKHSQFSVILTDQSMPMLTGLEFLAQAKQIQPDATRILITAVLSLSTVIDAINKGEIYRFIVKPWLREELLATIKNAIQRYELICRNAVLQAATLAMNEKLTKLNQSLEEQVGRVAEQNTQLENLNKALGENLQQSVELCLKTMQTFYPMLGAQARRVHEVCRAMADGLQLPPEQRQVLEISAWLHDVGLVGIPRQLIKRWLDYPDTLNEAERALIEQHTVMGQELASFVHNLEGVGKTIRSHHERYDGKGYPDRLAGESIPWLARLLAVAVGYASSNQPPREALEAVKLQGGSAYDPDAVRTFVRCLPQANVPRRQREVLLAELRPGMVLAKGIYTSNGLLLIPEGQTLSETNIDKLRAHNRVNPINQSLLVFC